MSRPRCLRWLAVTGLWLLLPALSASAQAPTRSAAGSSPTRPATQAASGPSVAGGYEITVAPDRADGLYRAGEKIVFTVNVMRDGRALTDGEVAYVLTENDVKQVASGTVRLRPDGTGGIVPAAFASPACAVLRAEYRLDGNRTVWAEAGAAVEPNQIGLSMPCPDDFDAFWAAQKKRLAEVPLEPKLTPVEASSIPAGVEAFDVQVPCAGGAPVSAYFARPKDAKPKSLPIYLTVHGAGVRSSSLVNPANQAAQGRLAMDLNAHGIPNGRPAEFYTNLLSGELRDYPRQGLGSRETYYFLGMYLRLVRALDFLCSQPEWDGRNVIVAGGSQGGAQAVVAAGLDPRVSILSASLPALCDLTGMQAGRSAGWPFQKAVLDANQVRTVRYFDVCHFAARTKATAVVRVGLIDHTCPPAGVFAMVNQLRGTKCLFVHPDVGHSYSPPATYAPANDKLRDLIAEAVKGGRQ